MRTTVMPVAYFYHLAKVISNVIKQHFTLKIYSSSSPPIFQTPLDSQFGGEILEPSRSRGLRTLAEEVERI